MQYKRKVQFPHGLFMLTMLLLGSPSAVFGQKLISTLAQTVITFDSTATSTETQLVSLAKVCSVPMGIERISQKPTNAQAVHVRRDSCLNVLTKILKKTPDYDFDLSDGVVNVYSRAIVNDRRNFLNLRLPQYRIENESLDGAKYHLRLRINKLLHPNRYYGGGYGGVSLNEAPSTNITLHVENLTVRQILNRLIRTRGNTIWVVRMRRSTLMPNEPFFVQTTRDESTADVPEFYWEFISLHN